MTVVAIISRMSQARVCQPHNEDIPMSLGDRFSAPVHFTYYLHSVFVLFAIAFLPVNVTVFQTITTATLRSLSRTTPRLSNRLSNRKTSPQSLYYPPIGKLRCWCRFYLQYRRVRRNEQIENLLGGKSRLCYYRPISCLLVL